MRVEYKQGRVVRGLVRGLAAVAVSALSQQALAANPGNPATLGATAQVDVLSLITIVEDANLDFGGIIPPSSGFQTFIVTLAGAMSTPNVGLFGDTGTNGQAVGGHVPGQYDILGTDGEPYTGNFSHNGCFGPGPGSKVVLVSITNNATGSLDDIDVKIGGVLKVFFDAVPGAYTCTYAIQANY